MISLRKEILELKVYTVPQEKNMVKLNQNESPFDIPSALKKIIHAQFEKSNWARYPECENQELLQQVAKYTNHLPEGTVLGAGSNELIQSLFLTFLEKGERLLISDPGFSLYERLGKIFQAEIIFSPLNKNFEYAEEEILKTIEKTDPKLTIFATPHNPCGAVLQEETIQEMLRLSSGIVVMDEAYFEFSGKTSLRLLDQFDNLLILRTFSKAFGLAGLRAGYLLGKPAIIEQIQKVKMPFSVNSFNQLALLNILKEREYMKKAVSQVIKERERMTHILSRIRGIHAYPSQANFILFEPGKKSARIVYEKLREKKVLIRAFDSPRLRDCLRVTVGQHKENTLFVEKLKESINDL